MDWNWWNYYLFIKIFSTKNMMRLKREWESKMHFYLGYRVCEDYEDLKIFNQRIKNIIQKERAKWIKNNEKKT